MSEIYSDDIIEESMVDEMVDEDAVAVVGMAGRFPGADSVENFWENLCNGKESITFFSARQLLKAGISPQVLDNPAYVPARGILSDIEMFDADFFGFYPREAEIMDVQHRIFLECAWQALENAGYDPDTYDGEIGVYAGAGMSTYFLSNLIPYLNVADPSFAYQAILSNDKDFLSTLTAYKLNLKGPAIGVQSACSTSLVAVHTACQSLANGECDMALAGGVSIDVPQVAGYMYEEGMILSKDGHCRAFDEKAGGTVPGSACGIVLLKRLNDAIEDKDNILAVIKGSAVNNDGSLKAGYTAPGIEGQTDVIAQALAVADIEPETISCLEAHGTGTSLGDPVEIEALKKAFDTGHGKKSFCAIGSVKTNIGHTNAASGIAGFIKTVLSVKHNMLVPCLHFNKANPGIDFENSPFFVNTQLTDWENSENIPMRAGVSSFGIGGTNAHIIIEGYHGYNGYNGYPCQNKPVPDSEKKNEKPALLILSAKTENALDKAAENLARHFENYPDIDIHDAAYTLQIGRRPFAHRRTLVCHNTKEAIQKLLNPGKKHLASSVIKSGKRPVVFMFSGQGTQYTGMTEDLYTNSRIFKEAVDCCAKKLLHLLDFDIRDVIWPKSPGIKRNLPDISSSDTCQPAIFVIEYALSQLFMKWGIRPAAVTGHSLGEYAAACVSGIFNLDDALKLVCKRGKLINDLPPGAMIAVPMPEEDIKSYMEPSLCFAAVNTPKRCVISGPLDAINRIVNRFEKDGVQPVRLKTSHAFHSSMIEPAMQPFADFFEGIDFGNIKIPMLSSVSGSWLKNEQVNKPEYWTNQMRSPVRFKEVIEKIFENNNGDDSPVLLEIGPGTTLAGIVRSHPATPCDHPVITSTRHPKIISDTDNKMSDTIHINEAVGRLWAAGTGIDWEGFYDGNRYYRVPLPSYPFERKRYWIEEQKFETIKKEPLLKKRSDDPALIWKNATETAAEKAGEQDMNSLKWQEKKADMNRLCLAYINRAFQESGAFIKENVKLSADGFFNKYSVLPQFHSLVSHWFTLLAEDGQIHISQKKSEKKSEDKYSNLAIIEQKVFDELLKKTETAWADEPLWLERLKKCGKNLEAIITGKEDPLMLLFPEKGFDTAEKMIKESSLVRYYNPIMQAALKKIIEKLPQETGIRVLEIGAGMGVCTSWLLPILPADRTEYYYTDVGQLFLNRAEKKFSDYPFVKYRILDIEQSLLSSEIKAGFDIIVAANVLHVTEKIDKSLANARQMLAKNGIFFLWEITDAPYYFHITDGLLMNDVDDKNRNRANPFLDTKQWTAALTNHGFSKVAQFPENDAAGSHIFMAFADESSKNENIPSAFSQKICKSTDKNKNLLQRRAEISDWFYLPSWKRSRLPALKPESKRYENILIFIDDKGLGRKIKSDLDKNGHDTIIITPGDSYKKEDSRAYTIASGCQSDYALLFDDLFSSDRLPDTCIHLWSITDSENNNNNNEKLDEKLLDESLNKGFYSLAFIAREFRRKAKSAPLKLMVVSNGIHDVTGEEPLYPEKAPIIAPIMVIGREYPEISCRHIDIVMPYNINKQGRKELSDQILAEKVLLAMQQQLVSDHFDPCIALRGKYRWIKAWEQAGCDIFENRDVSVLKEKGVYLITGGLGDIGGNLAELLAEKKKARLVLTGRSVHIERDKWDQWLQTHGENDPISIKIAKIKKLEILGAEVMIEAADVANYEQMKKVVSKAKSAFGRIDGIIHAAGATRANSFSLIDEINQKDCNKHFHSKIFGSLVLSQIVREESPDFCILVSSLSSVLGGTGLGAYTGANLFMDAFAVNAGRMEECVIKSVNSDIWQFTGDRTGKTDIRSSLAQLAMTAEQGKQVFEKIFEQPNINHILVSTADLKQRMAYKPVSFKQKVKKATEKKSLTHKRPDTGKPYIAPRNAVERQLVDIWQELLGIEPVGIQDDFFDLGGDSLLGTQIISRVRNRFNIDLPVKSLFAEPTIGGLSELMEQLRLEQADDEALASLIDQLEKMPDEEVKKLLDIENERVGKNETKS